MTRRRVADVTVVAVKGRSGLDATNIKDNAAAVWMHVVAAVVPGAVFREGEHMLMLTCPVDVRGDRTQAFDRVLRRCNPVGMSMSPETRARPVELMVEAVRDAIAATGECPVGWEVVTWQLDNMYMPYDVFVPEGYA